MPFQDMGLHSPENGDLRASNTERTKEDVTRVQYAGRNLKLAGQLRREPGRQWHSSQGKTLVIPQAIPRKKAFKEGGENQGNGVFKNRMRATLMGTSGYRKKGGKRNIRIKNKARYISMEEKRLGSSIDSPLKPLPWRYPTILRKEGEKAGLDAVRGPERF